jgi:hypothetical protein
MFNRFFLITLLLILGGCGGVPSLPNIPSLPSLPVTTPKEEPEKRPEVSEVSKMPVDCVREGDGFISFSYEDGHLEALTLIQTDEEITLSKGVTIIQKVPLGRYSTTVMGHQKESSEITTSLGCDGETKAYVLRVDVPSSSSEKSAVAGMLLKHPEGVLKVGSALENFNVKLTKLDAPYMVFEDLACPENERCPPTDNQVFVGATTIELPEGEYFIKPSSGGGQATYIDASSYTAIEVTIDGIEITSQQIVKENPKREVGEMITNTLIRGLLQ